MKKHWLYLVPVASLVALVAMMPQGHPPTDDDVVAVARMSELQYVDSAGKVSVVPARNVLEIRLCDDDLQHIRIELLYENGDFSLVDAQAFHLLRVGRDEQDVRLVRTKSSRLKFPKLR